MHRKSVNCTLHSRHVTNIKLFVGAFQFYLGHSVMNDIGTTIILCISCRSRNKRFFFIYLRNN